LQTRFFAAGIRWHFPGGSPLGGDYEGTGQVLDWLGRAFRASDGTIRIDVHDVIGNDEHAIWPGRPRGMAGRGVLGEWPVTW